MCLRQDNTTEGQSKVYFMTWPEQNVTGQLTTFLNLYRTGPTLFTCNIFYKLKVKSEISNCLFEEKIVKHAR